MVSSMRTWKTRQLLKIMVKFKLRSEARNAMQGRIIQIDQGTGAVGNSSKCFTKWFPLEGQRAT